MQRKPFSKAIATGIGIAAVLVLLAAGKAIAMGKMCLFSEVQGTVLLNNQPVPGAVVEREFRWSWKDETGKMKSRPVHRVNSSSRRSIGTRYLDP